MNLIKSFLNFNQQIFIFLGPEGTPDNMRRIRSEYGACEKIWKISRATEWRCGQTVQVDIFDQQNNRRF